MLLQCVSNPSGNFLEASLGQAEAVPTCRHSALLSDVENFGVVLQPVEIAGHFLGDVRLASRGQADHDNDELGADIALRNLAVGGDLGLGQAGDIERSWAQAGG